MIGIKKRIITFDVGGTNISGGVIEFRKKDYKFLDYFEQKNPKNSKEIKKIFLEKSREYKKIFKTKKVAVSTAKIVDSKRRIVSQAKSIYGRENFSFDFLQKAGFPVEIENDGACFARGEYLFGKGESSSILTLTLGTEIGGGFITQEGEILRGRNKSAMEVSFVKIKKEERWFDWREIASGSGLENAYFLKTKNKKTSEEIFDLRKKGDVESAKLIEEVEDCLGMGVSSLINIFDPEKIIFGGGLSQRKDFMKKVIGIAKKNVFNKKGKYKFLVSGLERKANQLGAASLYF